MEIALTPAQFGELQNLILAAQPILSQASTTSFVMERNGTKMEYDSDDVKFTLKDSE